MHTVVENIGSCGSSQLCTVLSRGLVRIAAVKEAEKVAKEALPAALALNTHTHTDTREQRSVRENLPRVFAACARQLPRNLESPMASSC